MTTNKSKPMDAAWAPIPNKATPAVAMMKKCARDAGVYALLNLILFIWQQKGLLADAAAVPAMWVCALLAGYQLGKCIAKGVR